MKENPGNILESLLENRQVSKVRLAEHLGVSHSFVHHLLKGRKEFNLSHLEKIQEYLNLSPDEYFSLARAIVPRLPGLQTFVSKFEVRCFEDLLIPFTRECFQALPKVRSKITVQLREPLSNPLWAGSVVLRSNSFRFDLRVFVGIAEPGLIQFWWRNADLRHSIPQRVKLQIPLVFGSADIRRLERKLQEIGSHFFRSTTHVSQTQKNYVKES